MSLGKRTSQGPLCILVKSPLCEVGLLGIGGAGQAAPKQDEQCEIRAEPPGVGAAGLESGPRGEVRSSMFRAPLFADGRIWLGRTYHARQVPTGVNCLLSSNGYIIIDALDLTDAGSPGIPARIRSSCQDVVRSAPIAAKIVWVCARAKPVVA